MSEHTKLPWEQKGRTISRDGILIADTYNFAVLDVDIANAAFIVRACNNNYQLLEIAKKMVEISPLWLPANVAEEHLGEAHALNAMMGMLQQVIKEAEGGRNVG
jgi:hypothetical protein